MFSGTGTTVISFDVIFNQISANSLDASQTASVISDLKSALAGYISPVKAAIGVTNAALGPTSGQQVQELIQVG